MPDKEKIINILNNIINDFSSKWKSHDEKNNGVSDYADKIIKLFEESYPAFSPDMPDKKLTSMMELIEWINSNKDSALDSRFNLVDAILVDELQTKITELLEKEHQMVIKSYKNGEQNASLPDMFVLTAEEYYTQTYKS